MFAGGWQPIDTRCAEVSVRIGTSLRLLRQQRTLAHAGRAWLPSGADPESVFAWRTVQIGALEPVLAQPMLGHWTGQSRAAKASGWCAFRGTVLCMSSFLRSWLLPIACCLH